MGVEGLHCHQSSKGFKKIFIFPAFSRVWAGRRDTLKKQV